MKGTTKTRESTAETVKDPLLEAIDFSAEVSRRFSATQVVHNFFANPVVNNITIGFTVSFVALSLGAAFGILSGRGAFIGMFSAGIIALVTAVLGGTRVQCSGPTAPMCAVSAVVVTFAYEGASSLSIAGYNPDHFINIVFFLTGVVLLLMGVLRLGRFIELVPNVVISGFMSGIAILIWIGQFKSLFGLYGKAPIGGPLYQNVLIVIATLVIMFQLPEMLKKMLPGAASLIPSTMVAIIVLSVTTNLFKLPVQYVAIDATLNNMSDLTNLIRNQWPVWSWEYVNAAIPFALQLAGLCYLDTLLTSLVIDKMSKEKTKQDKELMAQGTANAMVAMIGGIPGAQATIRSVLMIKEGANQRIAGISTGIFVLLGMLAFQPVVRCIPQAVFTGILLKVGYDVFDFIPIRLYMNELCKGSVHLREKIFRRYQEEQIFVTNLEMLFIVGTTLVTVLVDLNTAVIGSTVLFYMLSFITPQHKRIRDLKPILETKGIA